jgi:hypothetical protein
MFSHLNPDVHVTRNSYEPGYSLNPEVTSEVTERRTNPVSLFYKFGAVLFLFTDQGEGWQEYVVFPLIFCNAARPWCLQEESVVSSFALHNNQQSCMLLFVMMLLWSWHTVQ